MCVATPRAPFLKFLEATTASTHKLANSYETQQDLPGVAPGEGWGNSPRRSMLTPIGR